MKDLKRSADWKCMSSLFLDRIRAFYQEDYENTPTVYPLRRYPLPVGSRFMEYVVFIRFNKRVKMLSREKYATACFRAGFTVYCDYMPFPYGSCPFNKRFAELG